jgi:hypothetical protein
MKKFSASVTLLAFALVTGALPAVAADKVSDEVLVQRQAQTMSKLQELAAAAGKYSSKDVKVTATAHQITVDAIDQKTPPETTGAREIKAGVIISSIENEIDGKPEFAQVMVIHVNFIQPPHKRTPAPQGFDFFKAPSGGFVLHKT